MGVSHSRARPQRPVIPAFLWDSSAILALFDVDDADHARAMDVDHVEIPLHTMFQRSLRTIPERLHNDALPSPEPQLSIVAARLERLKDPTAFLTQLRREVDALAVPSEIILVPADPRGFGHELRWGLRQARGAYVITVDPDFSGPMAFLSHLWARRHEAEIIVASRYVDGSRVDMPAARSAASRLMHVVFRRGLSLGVNDGSSALRLYRTDVVNALRLEATDSDILQEVLVRAYAAGWRVLEIPLHYAPNPAVASKAYRRSRRRTFAPSGPCGSCAIRSRRPTTTTARTTARSRCSVIGSGAATDMSSS